MAQFKAGTYLTRGLDIVEVMGPTSEGYLYAVERGNSIAWWRAIDGGSCSLCEPLDLLWRVGALSEGLNAKSTALLQAPVELLCSRVILWSAWWARQPSLRSLMRA